MTDLIAGALAANAPAVTAPILRKSLRVILIPSPPLFCFDNINTTKKFIICQELFSIADGGITLKLSIVVE
ncbi:hypothetical protein JCM13991_18850 [Thermodesulfovibrio hydrogeniphilus]